MSIVSFYNVSRWYIIFINLLCEIKREPGGNLKLIVTHGHARQRQYLRDSCLRGPSSDPTLFQLTKVLMLSPDLRIWRPIAIPVRILFFRLGDFSNHWFSLVGLDV